MSLREIFPKAPSRSSGYDNTSCNQRCNISVCVSHFIGDAGYEAGILISHVIRNYSDLRLSTKRKHFPAFVYVLKRRVSNFKQRVGRWKHDCYKSANAAAILARFDMENYILHLYCMSGARYSLKIKPTTWFFESSV